MYYLKLVIEAFLSKFHEGCTQFFLGIISARLFRKQGPITCRVNWNSVNHSERFWITSLLNSSSLCMDSTHRQWNASRSKDGRNDFLFINAIIMELAKTHDKIWLVF